MRRKAMKESNKTNLVSGIISFCLIIGVGYMVVVETIALRPPLSSQVTADTQDGVLELSAALQKVRSEYLKISDEADRILIYKLFAGSSEYLSHAVSLQTTSQFDPMLGRVQSSYGWKRDKYKKFTDAVSDYLTEAGYDEPRKLSKEEDRKWFRDIFKSLTNAIKD
jgi:hypothetical protein